MRVSHKTVVGDQTLSARELVLMVVLVGNLDPAQYSSSEAKALIYKAKTVKEQNENC